MATTRPDAACHCRARQCTAHGDTKVLCAGGVVLILGHDPAVGRVWTVEEVCQVCAPMIPHAKPMGTAARPRPAAMARPPAATAAIPAQAQAQAQAQASAGVAGGFSAAPLFSAPAGAEDPAPHRRSPRPPQQRRRPRPQRGGQGR